jgi:hypothetical protein
VATSIDDAAALRTLVSNAGQLVPAATALIRETLQLTGAQPRGIIVVTARWLDAEMPHDRLPLGAVWPDSRTMSREGSDMGDLVGNRLSDEFDRMTAQKGWIVANERATR